MKNLLALGMAVALCGCLQSLSMVAGMKSGSHDSAPARKTADPLTLNFERDRRCDSDSSYAYNVESRKNAADKVRYAICHKSPHGDAYDVLNEKLLAGPYDHVEAAIAVIMCVGHGKCEFRGPRAVYESSCTSGECTFSPSKTTEFAMYASRTSVDDVRRAVASVDLPADFKTAFVTRYEACRNHVLDAVAQLDPRRKAIYVDTIAAARKRRQEDDSIAAPFTTRVAALKREIDSALLDKRPSRAMLDKALALRAQFVQACTKRKRSPIQCVSGQVSRPLTKLVVQLAVALDDLALAGAENATLLLARSHEDPAVDIHVAVNVALGTEMSRWYAWSQAKDKGVDDSVLAQKFGNPPPLDLRNENNEAGYAPPGILEFSSDIEAAAKRDNVPLVEVARTIRRVERKGKLASISFVDIVSKSEEQVGCRDTNKLDHITAAGDVIYQEDCSRAKWIVRVHRDHVEPIAIPIDESAALSPGTFVTAVVDDKTRKGHVVTAFASAKAAESESPLQIRGFTP
jgi:hypothetical protein